ncbi:Bestrophin, RFP-TM, chloride channel-domain-containing protein [Cubamyces menziesii]|nr:Bestrophin, RFP-TM, chloride channel-domain-containing protein [Cubamyces menziesii]
MAQPSNAQARSSTGHVLLPAFNSNDVPVLVPLVTSRSLISWTFGRGTVIWRIWPAVLLHTAFAAAVVTISMKTHFNLGIPNVMLTVLGVVIGFVISYRASSGYDRYWQGRGAWSDLARTSRTFSRLVWIHVPLKLAPIPTDPSGKAGELDVSVARRVMAEKRAALGLIEGFVVAVKHHLRGEMGIYYEDLYPLVKPLHDHAHHKHGKNAQPSTADPAVVVSSPRDLHPEDPLPLPVALPSGKKPARPSTSLQPSTHDPIIPPINAYGTFTPPPPPRSLHPTRSLSSLSSLSSSGTSSDQGADRRPLLPGSVPSGIRTRGLFGAVSADLVPFAAFWRGLGYVLGLRRGVGRVDEEGGWEEVGGGEEGGIQRRWDEDDENGRPTGGANGGEGRTRRTLRETTDRLGFTHSKHRPRLAGGGENLPLEILRSLSVWVSVLDERGVVPGTTLGGMYGCLSAFEDSLCTLERILTTPLPFVYSVHIRTVWIYLFFLPFQLVDLFGWYAIPGVAIAAFIYLGMIAAGEEIEQPFGAYLPSPLESTDADTNDLDLDFFCRAIVHADIERLKRIVCPNVYLGAHHSGARIPLAHDAAVDGHTRLEAVFGR